MTESFGVDVTAVAILISDGDASGIRSAVSLGYKLRQLDGFDMMRRTTPKINELEGGFHFCADLLRGDNQHFRHPGIGGKGPVGRPVVGDGGDSYISITSGKQIPRIAPGFTLGKGRRQHQREDTTRLQLDVRQIDKIGRQSGVAMSERFRKASANLLQPGTHSLLLIFRSVETGKGGNRNFRRFVVGWAREGRIHNHDIEQRMPYVERLFRFPVLAASYSLFTQAKKGCNLYVVDEFQRSDMRMLVLVVTVGHRDDSGGSENNAWMGV